LWLQIPVDTIAPTTKTISLVIAMCFGSKGFLGILYVHILSYDVYFSSARLLKRLDFEELKFSLYFLGYEVKAFMIQWNHALP
jgi:hypothetical protein